jgi:hypothetical protein
MSKPIAGDYPEYFGKYINQVAEEDLAEAFKSQFPKLDIFLRSIDETDAEYAYAPGKWTLKELLQHVIDTERIFNYRALCIARKETVSLPPFDENLYAENSDANSRSWKRLSNELINVRRSTEDLFNSFSEEMLQRKGLANNNSISVLSLGFITIGHVAHHIKIAEEKYLKKAAVAAQ